MRILLLIFLLAGTLKSVACDVCGGVASSFYSDIMPKSNNHFVGLRYLHQSFSSHHPTLFDDEIPSKSKEYFHTAEVFGQYNPHKRIQISGFFPIHFFNRMEENIQTRTRGFGDIRLRLNIVAHQTNGIKRIQHRVVLGGGIKLPTGKSNIVLNEHKWVIANMQPGTGSVDIFWSMNYTLRIRQWGILSDINYRLNTANKSDYKSGNRLNSALRTFYWHELPNIQGSILPQLGILHEFAQSDFEDWSARNTNDFSGGHSLFLALATDLYVNNIRFRTAFDIPVWQDISSGYVANNYRLSASILFLFNQSKNKEK